MAEERRRVSIQESILVAEPPDHVFEFLRTVDNLRQWTWFRHIHGVEANMYQAEDPDGTCQFLWIQDPSRRRIILHLTQNRDSPTLVVSVSGSGQGTCVHSRYSSFHIRAVQRHQLHEQMTAIKRLVEGGNCQTVSKTAH